ncbi:hypothetical protein [Pengzhenrongella phosphoraccumulans]|uniref:hypothetical protein n=1 Tax=Pengzhenrongella phosphoraccumulans TaxID=3114394 RepID=UPI00388F6517
MVDPRLVWLGRRNVIVTVAAAVVLSFVAVAAHGFTPTPQLRGPSVPLGVPTVQAMLMGTVLALAVRAADADLEALSPRPIRTYRALIGAGLVAVLLALLVGSTTIAGLSGPDQLAAIRTLSVVAALTTLVTWRTSFSTAAAVLLAYLGCVLFAGVDPDGHLAWWARLLAPWEPTTDPWITAIAIGATLYAFAATPTNHPTD